MAPDAIKVYDDIEGYDGMPNAWNKRVFTKGDDPKSCLLYTSCAERLPISSQERFLARKCLL